MLAAVLSLFCLIIGNTIVRRNIIIALHNIAQGHLLVVG